MSSFFATFIIAIIIIGLAFVGLLIGWILTGKPFAAKSCGGGLKRFEKGKCGDDIKCDLCGKKGKDPSDTSSDAS